MIKKFFVNYYCNIKIHYLLLVTMYNKSCINYGNRKPVLPKKLYGS